MRKIALFLDDGARLSPSLRIEGFRKAIEESEEEICLYIYRSKAQRGLDEAYSIGEYNIFTLAPPEQFDGVIFDLDNLHSVSENWYGDKVCRKLVEKVRRSGVPAISIGNRVEGFHHVGINNYSAMKGIIKHLNTWHSCRDFWFVLGSKDNYENQRRTEALRDYCEAHGLDVSEDRFYFESYKELSGHRGFKALYEKFGRLPEAVICANDLVAIGVCEEAKKYGFRIPEDFLVTGFDDLESSEIYVPSITTANQDFIEHGRRSIAILQRIWEGEELYDELTVSTKLVCRESCGCMGAGERSLPINRAVLSEIERSEIDAQLNLLEYELLNCDNLNEIGDVFVKSASFLNCSALYLVLDESFGRFGGLEYTDTEGAPGEGEYTPRVDDYPEQLQVIFAVENGKITLTNKKVTLAEASSLFKPDGNTDYLFLPIHLRQYTIGFFVVKDSLALIQKPYLSRAIQALTTAIKNHYSRERLNSINNFLKTQSITDSMTGFYNRLGYLQLAEAMFGKKNQDNEAMAVIYLDMDRLKQMNDSFGHKSGDISITAIASAIKKHVPADSLVFRMGGDEFLVLAGLSGEAEILEMLENIREEIPNYPECRLLPYPPSISAGFVITEPEAEKPLESYVKLADMMMYEQKTEKKTVKGSKR
ncbi:MAG: GGDEF domain-containing protein [Lachnospiraceae bacterium]|nr:GGDEF domain-containing protein [Lachnospiraceae bacterium]